MSESSCWVDELERSINNLKLEVYDYDNFENFNLIGEGSFGKVYKAVIKTTKMTVAMKNINVDNKEAAEAFINELKLQQAVNKHINIIRFFGISRKDRRSYLLILEHADNGNLRDYLNSRLLNLSEKLRLAKQITSAIAEMHANDIIHKDLHPGNILVCQGHVKVADFGLSEKMGQRNNNSFSSKSKIRGVALFIDPQCFKPGIKYKRGKEADVYSLGVLFWEIFSTGIHPSRIKKEIPLEYEKICDECRKEDPKERPNIHEVLDKLHSLKDTSTITTIIVNSDGNIGDSKQLGLTFDVLDIENYYNNNDPGIENDDGNNDPDIENSVSSDLCIEDSSDVNFNSDDVAQNSELLTALITVVRNELNSGIMTKKRLKECIQENIDSKQKTLKELLVYLQNHSQQEPNFSVILGLFYQLGIGIQEDLGKAYTQYLHAASKNNDIGLYLLGCCYESGRGTIELESEAFRCYKKPAEMGFHAAQFKYGRCFHLGIGTKVDYSNAFQWYERAAEESHIAKNNLAVLYQRGNGIKKNESKAFDLYLESAEAGSPEAQYNVGNCYKKGCGVGVNKEQAVNWYQNSANGGNEFGQYELGKAYESGKGAKKNIEAAIKWYREASDQGNKDATVRLKALQQKQKSIFRAITL